MLWEINIHPSYGQTDTHALSVCADAVDLGVAEKPIIRTAIGYLIDADLSKEQIQQLADQLLADVVVQHPIVAPVGDAALCVVPKKAKTAARIVYVFPKPGVTDSVAESVFKAISDFGWKANFVRTFKKYWIDNISEYDFRRLCSKSLANDAIEQVIFDRLSSDMSFKGHPYNFQLKTVPISNLEDDKLIQLSKAGQLSLSLVEMQTIQKHFQNEEKGREPTDVELETIAQTWSEHCSHKTLAGKIEYSGPKGEKHFENMLKETIFAATMKIRENLGKDDFCVSVFSDNAGVVRFDDKYNVCFKAETHNRPSALEPYGGANTGLGGVLRDTMGTGLGAKPICSTDVFCFAPPNTPYNEIPSGILHPRRIMKGAVSGVRDYGNRMGVPTVNGAVFFDKRYLGNPLVFCGNIGLIPREMSFGKAEVGDLIVAMGGRTGRDGIHGATFSSAELSTESETVSGGAVQIGDPIVEKMMLDVMLVARDRGLYNAVTDCGAGGFSSAIGEMGENIGAIVDLEKAPLKYEGLSYTEIWISEAQERMIFAVPPSKWEELKNLCDGENVEATVLGVYEPTGRLHLRFNGNSVCDLSMKFLHKGRPPVVRKAVYTPIKCEPLKWNTPNASAKSFNNDLLRILASPNVASKHDIIHQYDSEVQGGSIVKPLVGVCNDGPSDAAVVRPVFGSNRGFAVSCGMNPYFGDVDTYAMAASSIDEAVRNCVAVGANPKMISILDNFCWGNTERPETLGSLVNAAIACHDVAIGLGTPFISGKDSLNNEFRERGTNERISIPASLLISAIGICEDVSKCVTMDAKEQGNVLFQIGETKNEFGGSHYFLGQQKDSGPAPVVDVPQAKKTFEAVYQAIQSGLLRSCHDLSEGGLAVSLAEMCFSGGLGAKIKLQKENGFDVVQLFSETNSRFVCEIAPENEAEFASVFQKAGVSCIRLGVLTEETDLIICGGDGCELIHLDIAEMKAAWRTSVTGII